MKRFVLGAIAICWLSVAVSSQSDSIDLKAAQKQLKRSLIKHTKNVYAVDYTGCEASIKVPGGFSSYISDSSSPPAFGFGGFPSDTSGPNFGGAPGGPTSFYRFLINFAALDASMVNVRPGWKDNSVIVVEEALVGNAIRTKRKGEIEAATAFYLITKAKSATGVANAIRELIERCSVIR